MWVIFREVEGDSSLITRLLICDPLHDDSRGGERRQGIGGGYRIEVYQPVVPLKSLLGVSEKGEDSADT